VSAPAAAPPEAPPTAAALQGGWAGDLVRSGGAVWLAWSTAPDTEERLFTAAHWARPVKREESLRDGVTADDWRRVTPNRMAVWLGRVEGGRVVEPRQIGSSEHAVEGPAAAPLAGGAPVVVWAEWSEAGSTLVAVVDGEREVIAQAPGAILGPRAAGDGRGGICVVWQQWPGPGDAADRPEVRAARRLGSVGTSAWSAPETVSPRGESAWAPTVAVGSDGAVWCAWDAWDPLDGRDGGVYRVRLRAMTHGGAWCDVVDVSPPDH
jgi:hypothetical protein